MSLGSIISRSPKQGCLCPNKKWLVSYKKFKYKKDFILMFGIGHALTKHGYEMSIADLKHDLWEFQLNCIGTWDLLWLTSNSQRSHHGPCSSRDCFRSSHFRKISSVLTSFEHGNKKDVFEIIYYERWYFFCNQFFNKLHFVMCILDFRRPPCTFGLWRVL